MKKISLYLVIAFISVFGFAGITSAIDFPNSINSSINYDYVGNNGFCNLGATAGGSICAKQYSGGGISGKAFCTAFTKTAPEGITCTKVDWISGNNDLNEQVAAMIGSVINYVRDSNNSISWDNYYYAELAINRLLEYGISKGYGTSYNSISRINTNASGFNKSKYNNLLKIANYTFQNYGKTNVTISSPSFDSTSGKAKATVVCTDYKGNKINCKLSKKEIKYSTNGTDWQTVTASIDNEDTNAISAIIPTTAIKVKFEVEDKQCWNTAQNYSCGSNYQSLTPNYLVPKCKTKSAKSAEITNSSYKLEVHKRDADNQPLNGATVKITKDGQNFIDDNDGYVEIVNGRIDFNNVAAGEYCFREVKSPAGYKLSEEVPCITISESNPTGTIIIKNEKEDKKSLTINKVDASGNPVVGATIAIYDLDSLSSLEEGQTAEPMMTFTTGEQATVIDDRFEVGKTYRVVEEELPKDGGYIVKDAAKDIKISANNSDNVVTLTNIQSSIKISKQSVTSTKELPGAKITITDAQGNEVQSWTSTDKPQEIQGLSDGDYTLTETTAPQGYTVAESIKFTIENGVVKGDDDNTIVMKDATIVEVPDTFNLQNIIAMISGIVLVGIGTGVLFYETKKKKA